MEFRFSSMRFCRSTSIVAAFLFCSFAASDESSFSWQPVQPNMRMRRGSYQTQISNEDECKTRCVETSSCIGVDWHGGHVSCFLLYDSTASPYSADGFRHWRITRTGPTLISQATPAAATAAATTAATTTAATTTATTTSRATAKKTTTMTADISHDDGDFYSWQPVQFNVRQKTGDIQTEISNEESCKTRCVQKKDCIGIDWHNRTAACLLLYDCNASLQSETGYLHWEIRRYKSTPITCQDVVRRYENQHRSNQTVSTLCDSKDDLTTVVKVLSVLLVVTIVVIAGLICNTWRLYQNIRNCTCHVKDVDFAHKAQENGYQTYLGTPTQPVAEYTDIVRSLPPIPYESETVYADIDDARHI